MMSPQMPGRDDDSFIGHTRDSYPRSSGGLPHCLTTPGVDGPWKSRRLRFVLSFRFHHRLQVSVEHLLLRLIVRLGRDLFPRRGCTSSASGHAERDGRDYSESRELTNNLHRCAPGKRTERMSRAIPVEIQLALRAWRKRRTIPCPAI